MMILATTLLSLATGPAAAPLRVVLHPEVEVATSPLRLRDVARFEGDHELSARLGDIPLGRAPAPGYRRVVTPGGVRMALRVQGLDVADFTIEGAEQSVVTARYDQLDPRRLERFAEDFVRTNYPEPSSRMLLEQRGRAAGLPVLENQGDPRLEATWHSPASGAETLSVLVSGYQGDHHLGDRVVTYRVRRFAPVFRLTTELARGDALRASQVVQVETEITRLRGRLVSSREELADMVARRRLPAGSVLRRDDLQAPLLVRRGDPVHMVYRSGALEVVARGVALQPGRKGEFIRVENPSSEKHLSVQILGRQGGNVLTRIP